MVTLISKKHLSYLEKEVEFWRKRADLERERADRLADQVLILNGQPAMSDTVRSEQLLQANQYAAEHSKIQKQMDAIFADINADVMGGEVEEEETVTEGIERR